MALLPEARAWLRTDSLAARVDLLLVRVERVASRVDLATRRLADDLLRALAASSRVASALAGSFAGLVSRDGRFSLRRWGRERGSALIRSEDRSSVIKQPNPRKLRPT